MANRAKRHIAPSRLPKPSERLTVILPSAAIGKRMKSKGAKALMPLSHGICILEHQIRNIQKIYPTADIIVVVGFEAQKIIEHLWGQFDVRFIHNSDYEHNNVVGSVAMAIDASLLSNTLLIHGDIVFNTHTIADIHKGGSKVLVDTHNQISAKKVGVAEHKGMVTNMSYALPTKWGQIAYFADNEIQMLCKNIRNGEARPQWFLYELINLIISQGGRFEAYKATGSKICEVDKYTDLQKARTI